MARAVLDGCEVATSSAASRRRPGRKVGTHHRGRTLSASCPLCGSEHTAVLETRQAGADAIRRRRKCLGCRFRYSTLETITRAAAIEAAAHRARRTDADEPRPDPAP
ncbi:hypothetical protein [Thiocapsa sp. UBA6158]|uniref:NrdR family transcriptional regulator n=1 Tax=Thiocapsa sp. UBA6158 TaxID=1947692 RepID=UPI0039C9564B